MNFSPNYIRQVLFDQFPISFYAKDLAGKYRFVNAQQTKTANKTEADFLNKTDADIIPKKDAIIIQNNDQQALAAGTPQKFVEVVHLGPSDTRVFLSIKKSIVDSETGEKIGIVGYSIDLTAEFVLKHELSTIIAHTPGNIFWKDGQGQYKGCNNNVANSLKLNNPEEIVGKTNYDLLAKKLADEATENDRQVLQYGEEQLFEENGWDIEGNPAVYLTRKVPIRDMDGNITGLIGTSLDITPQKEKERLERQNTVREETITRLKTLVGSLTHEVRNPLFNVSLAIERVEDLLVSLKKEREVLTATYPDIEKFLSITQDEIVKQEAFFNTLDKMIHATSQLMTLQLNNIRMGKVDDSNFHDCDATICLQAAISTYPFKYQDKLDIIHLDITDNFSFWGDETLFKHIIWNLLQNALHFVEEEGKGEIYISIEERANSHVIYVKDTAKGMSQEVAQNIFQPFYTKRKNGFGLGLYFCQQMMQSFGGSIECDAKLGEYTCFCLIFPK